MANNTDPNAHAKLGPSGADRWMTCTASVALIDRLTRAGDIPERDSSIYAAEGTVAHTIRENSLGLGVEAHSFIGQKMTADGFEFEVDEDMADHIQPGVDWLREMLPKIDIEIRVRLDPWLPGQFGTMDSGGIYVAGDALIVDDFKYGAGEPVSAIDNRQMRLYALGYWHHIGRPKVKKVLMVIDQPRAGGMKFWEITLDELLAFGREAADAYLRIKTGNVEFKPTVKGCRWCPVKRTRGGCPEYNREMHTIFAEAFAEEYFDLTGGPFFLDAGRITPEQRGRIALHADEAKKWIDKLCADSLAQAVEGDPDPRTKAVQGKRGARKISDTERAGEILFGALGMEAYKPLELIPLGEMEKRLKPSTRKPGHPEAWKLLEEMMAYGPAKPVLASEDDERAPYVPLADEFDDL